jgi:hypothetical protein
MAVTRAQDQECGVDQDMEAHLSAQEAAGGERRCKEQHQVEVLLTHACLEWEGKPHVLEHRSDALKL